MLINLRNALMAGKRLPYDAEVEYLESTGTQYINTGVDYYADFEILCQGHPSTYSYNRLLGTASSRSVRAISSSNNCWVFYPGAIVSTAACGDTHLLSWIDGIISVDGAVIANNPKEFTGGSLLLFATATTTLGRVKISSCKLYDENGVLVRDYIPVRKGTVGYLYDRVSGKLFGNAGSGDFALGQDVVPVEYIESSGTQWINTGITADTNTKVRAKLNCLEYTGDVILGGYYSTDNADYRIFQTGATVFYYDGPGSVYGRIQVDNINVVNRIAEIELGNFYITDFTTGVTVTRTAYTGTANTPITLCHWGAANATGRNSKCRFYYVDIFNGQTAQLALKAIRVGSGSTWEGAMMDTLTRRIYRNAGTGAFTYGNNLKYPIPSE